MSDGSGSTRTSSGSITTTGSARSPSSSTTSGSSTSRIYSPTFGGAVDPTSSSPPDAGGADNGNDGSPTASASLYLYTFLATLVLLLGVSSAIVIRSLVLRRRHRRLIEEAIRNGTWVPPVSGRSARVDPANKPKVHEAHLVDVRDRDLAWSGVMPMYACYHKDTTSSSPSQADAAPPAAVQPPRRQHIFQSLMTRGSRSATPSGTSTPVPTYPLTTLSTTNPALSTGAATTAASALRGSAVDLTSAAPEPQTVHVAFIIAMPSPDPIRPPPPGREDEAELPELQVGFAEVALFQPSSSLDSGGSGDDKGEGMSAGYRSAKSLDASDGDH